MRKIDDILHFRTDISPFVVHLTRKRDKVSSKQSLEKIITERKLIQSVNKISDARYGGNDIGVSSEYFSAICMTETPVSEIHCLLEIEGRQINLSSHGLVFQKEKLQKRGLSPVLYINNEQSGKESVFEAIFSLIKSHPEPAKELLPLFSVFGKKVKKLGAQVPPIGEVDWTWEREWRWPATKGDLSFDDTDVFVGLCPNDEIDHFEKLFPDVRFIDPSRNMKWYATKLIEARKRLEMQHSVV